MKILKIMKEGDFVAKSRRGKNIKGLTVMGTCPVCGRTGVKLLWETKNEENESLNVCNRCGK